jgi:FAD/FMN-containing dehydrogenase
VLDVTALAHRVGGRLLPVAAPHPQAGDNPWAIEEDPGAFHTTGWFGAYDAGHSAFAVAAESSADIAAPVDFARAHRTGLVIKGTGHDYLGRSSAPGSLLLWTHRMREITVHDAFIPAGQAAITPSASSSPRSA